MGAGGWAPKGPTAECARACVLAMTRGDWAVLYLDYDVVCLWKLTGPSPPWEEGLRCPR